MQELNQIKMKLDSLAKALIWVEKLYLHSINDDHHPKINKNPMTSS